MSFGRGLARTARSLFSMSPMYLRRSCRLVGIGSRWRLTEPKLFLRASHNALVRYEDFRCSFRRDGCHRNELVLAVYAWSKTVSNGKLFGDWCYAFSYCRSLRKRRSFYEYRCARMVVAD